MMPAIKLEASRLIKTKIKEYGKTSPHAFIQKLPEEPEVFLHTFTRCVAFGSEKPVPCKISTDVLQGKHSHAAHAQGRPASQLGRPWLPTAAGGACDVDAKHAAGCKYTWRVLHPNGAATAAAESLV